MQVDLEASIAEAAELGMEKLCRPDPEACAAMQAHRAGGAVSGAAVSEQLEELLRSGLPAGQILKTLAQQVLERSQAVTTMIKVRPLSSAERMSWGGTEGMGPQKGRVRMEVSWEGSGLSLATSAPLLLFLALPLVLRTWPET